MRQLVAGFSTHFDRFDVLGWVLVLIVFLVSAGITHGHLLHAFLGSLGIVVLMLMVSYSIGLILGILENHEKLGELSGYITNGPELLCVLVGLANAQWKFGVSVPLGSNFANPVLFLISALLAASFWGLFNPFKLKPWLLLLGTMGLAGWFYLNPPVWLWVVVATGSTVVFYLLKPPDTAPIPENETPASMMMLLPAIIILVASGYALDPMVSFAATASNLSKGLIGFFILSFLTSWPEFRTMLSLFRINRPEAAWLNCIISNITNLWLAAGGAVAGLLFLR